MTDSHDMTWGELKAMIDGTEGVTDNTPIWYFDFSFPRSPNDGTPSDEIGVYVEDNCGMSVQ